jgi:hypothetical protein
MKISLTIISFLFCLSAFSQTKYFVSTSGNNTNNGLSNVNPFLTIQFAINSAQSGDSIIVSQGTYQENINFSGKNVKVCSNFVYSGDTTVISATIIDGNNIILPVVNFSDFESQNAHINGFKIRNGKGKNMVGYWGLATHGGGIFIKNASPVVKNCIITNNNCQNGGGIYAENSQATFENVIIQNNNINQPNIPNGGSGLFLLNCNSNIIRCTIKNNTDNPASGVSNYGGGGVLVYGGSTNIQSSKIIANYAKGYGGGISLYAGSSAFIENTIISNNIGGTAGNYTGGGIHTDNCNIVLKNSVIWGNDEFGISIGGYPNITIFNSILYNNVPAQIIGGFNLNITYTDIQGGSTGVGNINVNPNFVNPSANNFNLLNYSQCIGSGSNIGINQFDINMQNRPTPSGSNCDIGAYENSLGVSANSPPTAINDISSTAEDMAISLNILSNDSDVENQLDSTSVDLNLSIVGIQSTILTNSGNWSVNNSGLLTFVPLLNFNGTASIQYQVKDLQGITSNIATVNISVNPINDAPDSIIISEANINENLIITVGLLSTQDVDLNQVFTYSLVSGLGSTDNASFNIVNNQLYNSASFDYELLNTLSIRIKSTDQGGLSTEQIFLITVNNINDIQAVETTNDTYCNGIAANGAIDVIISQTNGPISYSWTGPNSFSSNTLDINGLESGNYELTVTDSLDSAVFNFVVNQIPTYDNLSVCYVTGDTLPGNHNRIYFNNPNMYNVQFYQILRESVVQDVYDFIGQVTPLDTSFLDLVSNNQSQSFSYKVRAIDSCGNFSNESTKHSTMLLQSNLSASNSVNLNWTAYNGSGYTSYYLYRSVNAGAFELMVTLPASQLSFNDVTANTAINEYAYFVSIVLPSCDFTKSNNIVRSNVKTLADGGLGIAENERLNSVEISPNPSTGIFNLSISEMNELRNRKFEIINTMGQRLMEIELASTQTHVAIDLSNQANGLYLIRDTEGTWVKQVILNK